MYSFPPKIKEKLKTNYQREYNLVHITITLVTVMSVLLGAATYYIYLNSIDALGLFSSESVSLFISIFIFEIFIILMIGGLFYVPFFLDDTLYRDIKRKKHIEIKDKITKRAILFVLFAFIYLISLKITIGNYRAKDPLAKGWLGLNNETIIFLLYFLFFISILGTVWIYYQNFHKKLRFFVKKKGYDTLTKISYNIDIIFTLFSVSIFLLTISLFIYMFAGARNLNSPWEFFSFLIFPIILLVFFLLFPVGNINKNFFSRLGIIMPFTFACVFFIGVSSFFLSFFTETNFANNLMKLTGKADSENQPYNIKEISLYDIDENYIVKGITCGRRLWNSESLVVFLPLYETDKKNNFKIKKENITQYQGKNYKVICDYINMLRSDKRSKDLGKIVTRIHNEAIKSYLFTHW